MQLDENCLKILRHVYKHPGVTVGKLKSKFHDQKYDVEAFLFIAEQNGLISVRVDYDLTRFLRTYPETSPVCCTTSGNNYVEERRLFTWGYLLPRS